MGVVEGSSGQVVGFLQQEFNPVEKFQAEKGTVGGRSAGGGRFSLQMG